MINKVFVFYNNNSEKINLSLSGFMLCINIIFLVWYIFFGYQSFFHSDSAASVLLAREIVDTGQFFPHDFNYVNSDLWVLFVHTFIIPLLAFMPAGYTTHAISALISSAIILYGIWLLSGIVLKDASKRVFIVAIYAAGFSGFAAENLYGQVSYGFVLAFSCYLLFASWKFLTSNNREQLYYGFFVGFIITLEVWANPQRALISYLLPLFITLVFYTCCGNAPLSAHGKKIVKLFLIMMMGTVLGVALHIIVISHVSHVGGAGSATWLDYNGMLHNTSFLLKQILAIFGGLVTPHISLTSPKGLYDAISFIAILSLIYLMGISLKKCIQERYNSAVFLAVYGIASFALVCFIELTTSVPDMSDPIQSSRYLVPPLLLLTFSVLTTHYDYRKHPIYFICYMLVCFVLVTDAYKTYVISDVNSNSGNQWGQPGQRHVHAMGIVNFLEKHGLHYGYATYWNAGILSVLSDEKVRVRQIQLSGGIPVPMRHLSSNRWYLPNAWVGKTFLLLTNQEVSLIDQEKMKVYGQKIIQKLSFENYTILVFAHNIAAGMPGWDRTYTTPAVFNASKYSASRVGRLVVNDDGSSALVANKGEAGPLHYGPYVDVDPGDYQVIFDVSSPYNKAGTIRLDVASSPDQKLYAERLLSSSSSPQVLRIHLEKLKTLEFRVWALGNERVVFKSVRIEHIK